MPQSCKVCQLGRKTVNALENDFINGTNIHQLSKRYGASDASIKFHTENHLPQKLVETVKEQLKLDSSRLLEEMNHLYHSMTEIYDRNYKKGFDKTALKALSEKRNMLQLMAQIIASFNKAQALEKEQAMEQSRFIQVENIPVHELSDNAKELVFEICSKQLGQNTGHSYRLTNTVDQEQSHVGAQPGISGDWANEDKNNSQNTQPEIRIRRKKLKRTKFSEPKSNDESMRFEPLESNPPIKDARLETSRRLFARALDVYNDEQDTQHNMHSSFAPVIPVQSHKKR